jgi:hypothetical protein
MEGPSVRITALRGGVFGGGGSAGVVYGGKTFPVFWLGGGVFY